jgi:hypothetical protein
VWASAGGVSPAALCCAPGAALCHGLPLSLSVHVNRVHGEEEGKGNNVWLRARMTEEERETTGNGTERRRRRQRQCGGENRAATRSSPK